MNKADHSPKAISEQAGGTPRLPKNRLQRPDLDRWLTAIHEAGHAVIGRRLGMVCGHASCGADHNSAGHAIVADPYAIAHQWELAGKHRDMESVFRGRIMTFQAGAEAAEEVAGGSPHFVGDDDDRFQIALMAEELGCDAVGEARLRRYTRQKVRRDRPKIERLAADLMARGRLTSKQIDALVWPRAELRDYVAYPQLRKRFGIVDSKKTVMEATRRNIFPRAWLFNGPFMWRIRDVEAWMAAQIQSSATSARGLTVAADKPGES